MNKEKVEAVEAYKEILDENNVMLNEMNAELHKCREHVKNEPENEELRRIAIRTLFSNIEAMCHRLKLSTLYYARKKRMNLKTQEIAIINEESFFLADNGVVKIKNIYLKTTGHVRFVFKIFAHVFNSKFKLDVKGQDWENFQDAINIRNRVTHPKYLSDMKITKPDFKKVVRAYDWFVASVNRLAKEI